MVTSEVIVLCITIFFVRILDVSLGTIRTIYTVKGKSLTGSLIGFVEVLVWFLIVKEALNTPDVSNIHNFMIAISYALGFATGTYIGGVISDKFIKGNFGVQVILSEDNDEIVEKIREKGYAVSVIDVKGKEEKKDRYMLFIEINKKHFDNLSNLIKSLDSKAFIVVNETKFVQNGFIK